MRTFLGRFAVVWATIAVALGLAVPAWGAEARPATLTILHGLPKFTADVYVNGTLTLDGFEPESVTDPITLPAGTYDVAIRDVGAPASSAPALEGTLVLAGGQNYSAIAHLDGGGGPTLALFRNDLSPVAAGTARLVVRNTADAGAIRLRIDGSPVEGTVAEGHGRPFSLAPRRARVSVVGADGSTLAATRVTLGEGTATVLYLVGSADDGTLDLMAQQFGDLNSPPGDVLTGSGGLGADPAAPRWQGLVAVAAVVAAGLLALHRSGRRRVFALVAALLAALALAPAAWGVPGPAANVGSVPRAAAPDRAPIARSDLAPIARSDLAPPAAAGAAVTIAVHSARASDLPTSRMDAAPTRIRISALGVSGAIVPVGVEVGSGGVEIPDDVRTIGWYRFGPRPGDAGSSVLVGHVASAAQGAGLFYHLRDLPPGARIEVAYADGTTRAFVVRARREYPKGGLPDDLFARSGSARLVLVTCGGPYDAATGHYRDNIVLYAVPRSGA